MRMISILCPFLIFLACSLQSVTADAQTLPFRTYTIEHGLSESVVHDLIQDRDGYVWIATGYGLNRFDGHQVDRWYSRDGLNDDQIYALFEDVQGRIWIGTESGVNIYEDGAVRSVTGLEDMERYSVISILQDREGEWWFGTDGAGVWLFESGGQLTQFSTVHGLGGNRVREIRQDGEGVLWFATDGGLTGLDTGNFNTWTRSDGLSGDQLYDLDIDERNSIWIATGSGISLMEDGEIQPVAVGPIYEELPTYSIRLDGLNRVWAGTEQGVLQITEGRVESYTTADGLPGQIVYSVMVDREGHPWFGTFGGGVALWMGDWLQNWSVDEGLTSNLVTSITGDSQGRIWIGSYGGGVLSKDAESMESWDRGDGLDDNKIHALWFDRQERLWAGTDAGLNRIEGGVVRSVESQFADLDSVRALYEQDSGDFWVGTYRNGVYRYRTDGQRDHFHDENLLPHNSVVAITGDSDGAVWFATYGGAVRYRDGEFMTITVEDGLPSNGVISLSADHPDGVWIGTYSGPALYRDGEVQTFSSEHIYASAVTHMLFHDSTGVIWMGTNQGLIRFDPDLYRTATNSRERERAWRQITREQGLPSNEFNTGALYRDREGAFWIGSVEGVSRFHPDRVPLSESRPLVHLQSVTVAGEEVDWSRRGSFSHDRNLIQFSFSGISFDAPSGILYEYRMAGVDSDWTVTYDRTVRYPSLSPGEYRFEVRAYNSSGVVSLNPASWSFEIERPLWMQWWVLMIAGVAVMGIILIIYNYYRIRRMVDIERMRVQIASDLHDDVGASLTELALQTDFLRAGNPEPEVGETLGQIGDHSRRIVSALDDIVWYIDARNDRAGDLTDRMQDHANSLLTVRGTDIHYNFSGLDMDRRLPVQIKENLYLIYKEAVNNIAKHSDATAVHVTLKVDGRNFYLEVADNGKKQQERRRSGQGLRNMNMRANRMGANTDIEVENGFRVVVRGRF
ncbi:MAG: two-component regulator propeller domain-containing protein [Balneolaceae bacterium]